MNSFSTLFIISCFIVLFSFWIITAFSTKKTTYKAGGWILRLIFYGVIILVIYLQNSVSFFSISLWPNSFIIEIIADVVTVVGLFIMLWARVVLGRNWSANIVLKENHSLITNGPYAYVRHPIYSGLILMVLGVTLYVNTIILAVFFVSFFFGAYYKARKEEKILITIFPDTYSEYKLNVKTLIPFIF